MDRLQRMRNVLSGVPVERPPFTAWVHLGTQHTAPETTAEAHLHFFEAYHLDLLKVMNDSSYPMPRGIETLSSPEQLHALEPFNPAETPFGNQWTVIEILARRMRGVALFVDTVFNAWNTLRRNVVKESIFTLMREAPDELEAALKVVNENLVRYAKGSLERGAAGVFLAVPGGEENLTDAQFERFMKPFDLALLEAVREHGECHVVHAHGSRSCFERISGYPAHVISFDSQGAGPTLSEARQKTAGVLMGGLEFSRFTSQSAAEVRAQVRTAIDAGGQTRFILAPGCSLPTYVYPELMHALTDELHRPRTV